MSDVMLGEGCSCRPGGCTRIGCEGGRYCYTTDGLPRTPPAFPDLFRDRDPVEPLNLPGSVWHGTRLMAS